MSRNWPMRLVFFGSGAFGLPSLRSLASNRGKYEVSLVVTRPDRPAGRRRRLRPTEIADWAEANGLEVLRVEDVNAPGIVSRIRGSVPDALVVIAFGQKLGRPLIGESFAINLHGSLLPKYRGAAPVNWAMIAGETVTGVSVITLAERMDAGEIFTQASTPIDPRETAGELHDRLAELGPRVLDETFERYQADQLDPIQQDESQASRAPKLRKTDGVVDFDRNAQLVRARVHGLNPWPGCSVTADGQLYKIGRVIDEPEHAHSNPPGLSLGGGLVACRVGVVRVREIQAPGGRMMSYEEFRRGRGDLRAGVRLETPGGRDGLGTELAR